MDLPLILHCRESMDDVIELVESGQDGRLRGIFHCFTGDEVQAKRVINAGFLMGIGGVLTYKNSTLGDVLDMVTVLDITEVPDVVPSFGVTTQ